MEFMPVVSTKLYKQVIEQIKRMIFNKTLKKGDKLPPERDMAVMFGVSRTAIREAMRSLEMVGLTESRQGEGNFIVSSFSENKIFEPLSLIFMLEDNAVELINVRSMLEIECAGLAAKAITPQELEELYGYKQLLIGEYEGLATDEADYMYHSLIAKASHNTLLYQMYSSIHEVVCNHIVNMRQMILQDSNNAAILAEQHSQVYEAIAKHECDQARQTMRIHMNYIYDQLCLKLKG
ncbi:MAG: GntR family transcriptional regulator [Firmicutes bacterium]|nr:GntR family transcriptional regulator [Bacillota bacterium]